MHAMQRNVCLNASVLKVSSNNDSTMLWCSLSFQEGCNLQNDLQ